MHSTPLATVRKWRGCGVWALKMSKPLENIMSVCGMEGKSRGLSWHFWLSRQGCSMETHHCVRKAFLSCVLRPTGDLGRTHLFVPVSATERLVYVNFTQAKVI